MSYTVKPFSGYRASGNSLVSHQVLNELVDYIENELVSISRAFQETQELELRTTKREPKRPADGMIVSADGTSWDPGSGKGIYAYLDGVWVLLSGGDGLVANTSQTPFYVVDQEARDMLREILIELKVHTLVWSTSLNFSVSHDLMRSQYYNVSIN